MAAKKHRDAKLAEQQAAAPPADAPAAPGAPAGGMSADAMTRLRELGELHEQGILTDEEFASEKAKLLEA